MKIAVLTLPLHTNYGGILQAYALQTVLKRMGHEVYLIDERKSKRSPWIMPIVYAKRLFWKYILRKKNDLYLEKTLRTIKRNTDSFIDKYINCFAFNNKTILKENIDTIIVGSDQIWRPLYYSNIKNAYLHFAKDWDILRISYAASFGTENIEYTKKQIKLCRKLIKLFKAISVRESQSVDLCHKIFNIEAELVLDPTLLLNASDYINLIKLSGIPNNKGNLMIHILDNNDFKNEIVNTIIENHNLIPFSVNAKHWNCYELPIEEKIYPPVESFLRGFYDAEYIITDSFHACVFSLIFKKPFYVLGNTERGMARFISFLKMFELEDRMINNVNDVSILRDIDYDKVYTKLDFYKRKSISFLKNSLSE